MSVLEEKIKKNRELLDAAEPSSGHLDRFQGKLDDLHVVAQKKYLPRMNKYYRVAAVIAVLIGLSLTYYLVSPDKSTNYVTAGALPADLLEAKMYYDRLANEKLQEIYQHAANSSEASYVKKLASDEIGLIDSASVKLEEQIREDQQNNRLINALLMSYKTKSDLLDDILNRLRNI
ncbi:MAG: hypothetical protein K0B08_12105 [Bacteroidales bacterium]|nr:hypothetical protein [Bacteroidales bacterium]